MPQLAVQRLYELTKDRDVYVTNMKDGIRFPMSTMPGEKVNHVYAGPMEAETLHFLECIATGRQPLVTAEHPPTASTGGGGRAASGAPRSASRSARERANRSSST